MSEKAPKQNKKEDAQSKPADLLSQKEIQRLLGIYGADGLREEGMYFVFPKGDGTTDEIFMHKFKLLGPIPVEERIQEHVAKSRGVELSRIKKLQKSMGIMEKGVLKEAPFHLALRQLLNENDSSAALDTLFEKNKGE